MSATTVLRGVCPFVDCGRVLPLPAGVTCGQRGVCPDCYRLYEVVVVDDDAGAVTLAPV